MDHLKKRWKHKVKKFEGRTQLNVGSQETCVVESQLDFLGCLGVEVSQEPHLPPLPPLEHEGDAKRIKEIEIDKMKRSTSSTEP